MVGNFVRQHRHRCRHAKGEIGHEGGGYQHPITESVHAVARQYGPTARQA